jgi:uncharacterized phage-associated protein
MKLQKLVYYAHGWWLAYRSPEQLLNEKPEVWRHGPVFSSMYHALKGFGNEPITTTQPDLPLRPPPDIDEDDDTVFNLLDWIWVRYGGYSAIRLSNMTHERGTPWQQMAQTHDYRVPEHTKIPDELMTAYFEEIEAPRQGITVTPH